MLNIRNLSIRDDSLCKDLAVWSSYQSFNESTNPALVEDKTLWTIRLTVLLKEMDMIRQIKSRGRATGLTVLRVLGQPDEMTTLTQTGTFYLIPLRRLGKNPTADGMPLLPGQAILCNDIVDVTSAVELLCITEHKIADIRVKKPSIASDARQMDVIQEES